MKLLQLLEGPSALEMKLDQVVEGPSAQRLGEPSDDPLALLGDGPDRLGTILAGISSNIGRRRRVITFGAFRRYFRHGAERQDYPLDWDLAKQD